MKNIKRGNITLMLSKDDALLDYKETLKFLDGKIGKLIIEEKSGHHFMTFKEVLEREISR
jgi:predicted esterase YcpF (UPF0227 family)